MKVEASSYDTVTWDPKPFDPGKMFYRLSNIAKTRVGERKEILLRAPCRIDVGLIDFSALKFTDENNYKVEVKGPEASETDVNCMSWERHNERINAAKTCLWIVTEIMPAAVQENLAKMGDAFYNYTLFGGKAMLMLFYRCDLAGTLFELKEAGLEGGWMTSAGPSLVTFTQDRIKEEKAINIFKRRGFGIVQLSPDNEGIKEE